MKKVFFMLISVLCMSTVFTDTANGFDENDIPLKNVTLYSSGVAHYEHEGIVKGSGKIDLLFLPSQISDVLKSIFVKDPAAKSLSINYQSEDTLKKTMQSLKIDLFGNDSIFKLLKAQKGAELEVYTPNKIVGKILNIDKSGDSENGVILSIVAEDGVKVISFNDVQSFKFTDPQRNEDLQKALALILEASAKERKLISIDIESAGERKIGFSYVMEAPIWKPTYRLDMGNNVASFQAWAIIDNSTDLDWKGVKLTLTSGRPIGFKQNLYEPYYTHRETIPILAGQAASPETFESAYDDSADYKARKAPMEMQKYAYESLDLSMTDVEEDAYFENQTVAKSIAGEMFAFTPVKPVNLPRQKSTMIPLSLTSLPAQKYSVFSAIPYGAEVHPKLCINIENNSGIKFPAGPITVFESGEYVGDAVLNFLPENEKRLIAFGDDMDVRGSKTESIDNKLQSIKIVKGVLHRKYKSSKNAVYTIRNAASKERSIIVEHPISSGFNLADEKKLLEKTANKYRFNIKVKASSQEKLSIEEERSFEEVLQINTMDNNAIIGIYSNSELPEKIKKTFKSILDEKVKVDKAQIALTDLQGEQKILNGEQDRVRKNIQAVGAETQQGKLFLDKLILIEEKLEDLKVKIEQAEKQYSKIKTDFVNYVEKINLE
ncbi:MULTISPECIES: DUF4139 domain-containing protein [unclassified Treponema]|uniref:DUF4139 domain-containing protein n=1 Tax=unclassified Treponema TaxID=2638727 RepID=UPI0020A54EB8|nr:MULTISPECIES: DUF4139 domain-containing protein [unclassified Treponema]UTC67152.1 DUF4139 domain-containing protein [Treponema sp. OMZ 789]UTC69882.1 DUF4139 domain-containing protein [Treponema sp. OMZ 790]UTC72597.1 DUF4139 domain-containing protein [Treponema sp. OMZ 791]